MQLAMHTDTREFGRLGWYVIDRKFDGVVRQHDPADNTRTTCGRFHQQHGNDQHAALLYLIRQLCGEPAPDQRFYSPAQQQMHAMRRNFLWPSLFPIRILFVRVLNLSPHLLLGTHNCLSYNSFHCVFLFVADGRGSTRSNVGTAATDLLMYTTQVSPPKVATAVLCTVV